MKTFEEEWHERFEKFAHRYNDEHLISGWSSSGLRRRLALFKGLLKGLNLNDSVNILDVGCGVGTYVRFLSDLGHKVVGLDYSVTSISRARVADQKHVASYVAGEGYNLPFCDKSFDVVVSIGVFQALENTELALDEMVRVLRPNGVLVVEFLNTFEVIAIAQSVVRKLKGQPHKVRTYSPFKVKHWITQRSIKFVKLAGVFLPPRSFSQLEWVLNRKWFQFIVEKIPWVSIVCAHAFLLVGRKDAKS